MSLEGKVALVTGGAGLVGAAVSRRLAREGALVVINGRSPSKLEALAGELKEAGLKAQAAPADVLEEDKVQALVDRIVGEHGHIDILVNTVGGGSSARITEMSFQTWREIVDLNLNSAFLCSRACLPHMIRERSGRIVSMGSGAYAGAIGLANYSASKSALIGFTKTLALEAAPHGITANVLVLGHVASPRWSAVPTEMLQALMAQVPMGRFIPPEEIAGTVAFLASPDGSNISGNVLHLTGGMDWVGPTVDVSKLRPRR